MTIENYTIDTQTEREMPAVAARQLLRAEIDKAAGDVPTLLGATADAAAVVMLDLVALCTAIAAAGTVADIKAAAAVLRDKYEPVTAALTTGGKRLPHMVKPGGDASALAEMIERGDKVAAVIASVV
jgi:hypothetical protein